MLRLPLKPIVKLLPHRLILIHLKLLLVIAILKVYVQKSKLMKLLQAMLNLLQRLLRQKLMMLILLQKVKLLKRG
jgi:hypothetical protein